MHKKCFSSALRCLESDSKAATPPQTQRNIPLERFTGVNRSQVTTYNTQTTFSIITQLLYLSRMDTEAFWKLTDDRGSATAEDKYVEEERPVISYSQGNSTRLRTVIKTRFNSD